MKSTVGEGRTMNVLWTADQYDMQLRDPRGIFNYLSHLGAGLNSSSRLTLSALRYTRSSTSLSERDVAIPLPSSSPFFLSLRNVALSTTPLGSPLFDGVDLLHITTWGASYTPLLLSRRLRGIEVVATVHDIGNALHPELYQYGSLERSALLGSLRQLARSGCTVIAVSEATKRDLVYHLEFPDDRVSVVHEGVDVIYKTVEYEVARNFLYDNYGIEKEYALYVGSSHPRKNLRRLLEAYCSAKSDGLPWDLLLVGVPPEDLAAIPGAKIDDVHALGYVPREHLPYFFAACRAFVFPSLYEGFGLPVLEAMACGAPVIASNRSSLPELVGEAGLLVDPYDVGALSESMMLLHGDEGLRNELRRKGPERASQFSWEKAVEGTLEVYEKCLM